MDTTITNEWIPPLVWLNEELPVMLDAPFASVKHETCYMKESVKREIVRNANKRERIMISSSVIDCKDIKTESITNGSLCRISPMRINHRAQIDVVDMNDEKSSIYKYLLIFKEQYSKFIVLRALRSKEAKEVALELVEIMTMIGAPRIIQSGNGRIYAEQVVREIRLLLRDFCVVHGDAPKNIDEIRDLRNSLKSWLAKNPGKQWNEGLKILQVTKNTSLDSQNGKIPSQLFFGRNICEDLRRTIGGKGITTNVSAEDALTLINSREQSSSVEDKNCDSFTENRENDSPDTDYIEDDVKIEITDEPLDPEHDKTLETENIAANSNNAVIGDDNFRCKICQNRFTTLEHLNNHVQSHTKIVNFECTLCCKSFRLLSVYEKHMKRFHDKPEENKSSESSCDRLLVAENEDKKSDTDETNRILLSEEKSINEKSIKQSIDKKTGIESFGKKLEIKSSDEKTEINSSLSLSRSSKRSKSSVVRKLKNSSSNLEINSRLECTYCKQKFNFPSVLQRHMRSHTNERPYVCKVCGKSFKQLGHLSQHSLTHTDYRSINCDICAIKFDSLASLKLHLQSHDEKELSNSKDTYRLLECDYCNKIFATKGVLERHIFTHTHVRQFGCKVCGRRFKQASHLKSHMFIHTGERKFECNVCPKRFTVANSLKKHMYVHNGEKPYQCDICGSRFLEKRNLNGHLMTHTNERPFSCKICGKRYTLADTLKRHISATHEDGRTYQCEICAKMFKQLAHLSVHKKIHNDERPFQCHLCEKNFKHKNVLKAHLAIHANVRPFECDSCKATFVRKTNLRTHVSAAHMNERPFVCTICNKRFKQISHLNGHIVVHSNSLPYQCDFCDRRCNRLDNLKKHMRLHSKNKT